MYEAIFKNIDDTLRKDAGCSSELDYIEQTSWILFLKYLDNFESEKKMTAHLNNSRYMRILDGQWRWTEWAVPKKEDNKTPDYDRMKTGEDLLNFVKTELFPHLASFRETGSKMDSMAYRVGEIFVELSNKLQSGYTLREVIDLVDQLEFSQDASKHELSLLYENKIKNMGNAGRNGGEYYTPRPLIKSMVKVINPKIGERVYDGAVGSAGFLCEAFEWMRRGELAATELKRLQKDTFFGKEKKSLAYVIGLMNMILHGIEAPNIEHTNTLAENIADIGPSDQMDVVLANPPFGGNERPEIKNNFPIPSGETAYLFLQHFIRVLKPQGRCGVVIKNTFLSNTDNASIALRKQLLEECNLFAVLDLPGGAFLGTGVKTVVLFFEKGRPTESIWYYQLDPGRKMGKNSPLHEQDLAEFVQLAETGEEGENSWLVARADISEESWDLTVNNPNRVEEVDNRTPAEIIAEIEELDAQAAQALQAIKELL